MEKKRSGQYIPGMKIVDQEDDEDDGIVGLEEDDLTEVDEPGQIDSDQFSEVESDKQVDDKPKSKLSI